MKTHEHRIATRARSAGAGSLRPVRPASRRAREGQGGLRQRRASGPRKAGEKEMVMVVRYYHKDDKSLCIVLDNTTDVVHPSTMALTDCVWFVPGTMAEDSP